MWVLSNTSCRVQSHRIRSGHSTSGDLFTSNGSNASTLSCHRTCGFTGWKRGVGAFVTHFAVCVLLSKKLADGRRPETAAALSPRLSVIRRPPGTAQSFGGVLDQKVSSWMKRWVLVSNCAILEKWFLVLKDVFLKLIHDSLIPLWTVLTQEWQAELLEFMSERHLTNGKFISIYFWSAESILNLFAAAFMCPFTFTQNSP